MKDRRIGIIGYGVIGKQIEYLISEDQVDQKVDFFYFDDLLYEKKTNNAFRFSDFDNNRFNDLEFYIGLGYNHLGRKREVCEQLVKNLFSFPSLVHKTAYIHPSARIGSGVIIYPMCNIGFDVQILDGVHINNSSVICHDSFIGKCTFISPGVTLSGYVQIGEECFLGSGTVVTNGIKVGNKVKIGAGTVITKEIDDNLLVIGNPFRVVKHLDIK